MFKNFIIFVIKLYQNTISLLFPNTCRFEPTCSQYMIDSVEKNGIIMGILYGICRLTRCHPLSKHNHWDPA